MFRYLEHVNFPLIVDQVRFPHRRYRINNLYQLVGFLWNERISNIHFASSSMTDNMAVLEFRLEGAEYQIRQNLRRQNLAGFSGNLHLTLIEASHMHQTFKERAGEEYVRATQRH